HEIGVHERTQLFHVLAAQGVAPFALERLNLLAIVSGHAFLLLVSLRPNPKKANHGLVTLQQQIVPVDCKGFPVEGCLADVVGFEAQQQAMSARGAERDRCACPTVNRNDRFDRGDRDSRWNLYPALALGPGSELLIRTRDRDERIDRAFPPESGRLE